MDFLFWLIAVLSGAAALALAAATIWFGDLNQDEGWYLYAAKMVSRGMRPYRDFFFTQGPLLPWVYGMFTPLWTPFGLLGGRILTAIFGLASTILAGVLAATDLPRKTDGGPSPLPRSAALTAFLLLAVCPYHAYFTAIPKTYALSALCLVGGMLSVEASLRLKRGAPLSALGGFLLACAAAARLSLGAALPVAGIWLLALAFRKRTASPVPRWHWLAFGIGGIIGLALFFFQPLTQSFPSFRFANSFHTARQGGGMIFTAGSLARLARGYIALAGVAILATAAIALLPAEKRRAVFSRRDGAYGGGPLLWLACFAAIFIVHILSPFPYDDYQTPVMPLLAAAVSAIAWRIAAAVPALSRPGRAMPLLAALLAWCCVSAATSPLCQDWFVAGQDAFWPVMKEKSSLALLREIGENVASMSSQDKPLLTQDAYIAVEADRDLPHGFEMGPFGYFPELPDETAEAMHVVNSNGMKRLILECDADLALKSDYTFRIGAPSMACRPLEETLEFIDTLFLEYAPGEVIEHFGQGNGNLEIWYHRLKDDSSASSAVIE